MRNRQDNPSGNRGRRGKGRGGRRPMLGRLFAHGDLRFLILKLIEEKPPHGYEIIKAYSPSPGVIYPTLTLLEELDWIRVIASERSKRLFEITSDGSLALKANRATVEAILARIAEFSKAQSSDATRDPNLTGEAGMAPQLRLALDDLRRAIERRLESNPPTNDRIATIVEALSTAASEIERS